MSDIVVNTNNLQKSFNKKIVVENLCLRIPKGCIFGLLGPNGVGKTTTIRMLLGLIYPDNGSIEIFGKDFDIVEFSNGNGSNPNDCVRNIFIKMDKLIYSFFPWSTITRYIFKFYIWQF
ncbi:ATP-binding cassette domain-containing protein [Clostridium lacusfryxellense]|uniref:ATP-binding cassette domain-containing protein n=1 Tax=Clostridium lacusfryxellense TaxID=205328 RepID=UPI002484957F|nr:ATP-binding cassette domain-containing protein [Clostridium lacusfryxellense]